VGATIRFGQWRVSMPGFVWSKLQLIHQSLYQKFAEEKKEISLNRVNIVFWWLG
jgi:hypothetical protein